jgi:hypothetical protein
MRDVADAAAVPPELRRVRLGSSWDGPVHGLLALLFVALQLMPIVVISLYLVRLHPYAVAALLAAGATAIFAQARRSLGPTEVLLGLDGLSVLSGGRPRFVPWREIRAARLVRFDVVLALRSGEQLRIPVSAPDPARDRALIDGIRAEIARAPTTPPPTVAALQRGGRDLEQWRDALRLLATRATAYRGAPVDLDDLERAVAARDVPAEQRVGAAIALAALSDDGRTRVRLAAASSADLPLRDALADIAAERWVPATIRRAVRG